VNTKGNFDWLLSSGDKIPETVIMEQSFNPTVGGGMPRSKSYPSEHIENLVARSDFLGTGVPIERWSYPTASDHFTVTIYLVHISGVAFGGKEQIISGANIFIARAGGPVAYKGHTINAVDPDFPQFELNHEYIFFGKELCAGLYKVDSDQALLVKDDGTVIEMDSKTRHSAVFSGRDKNSILTEAIAALLEHPHALKVQTEKGETWGTRHPGFWRLGLERGGWLG
jgi:hypothetical protein